MRAIGRFLVLLVLAAALVGCGGSSGKSRDTTAPVITLAGANPQIIEAGTPYIELGATATDNRDGDLSNAVVIDASQVDTAVPGSYLVSYRATDAAGNTGATTRAVVVADTTPPVITLLGDDPQIIVAGSPYIEMGATASDTLDGDLSAQISIDATTVDTMVAGDHAVTYDVTDAAGNAAVTATRTVRVELPPPPAAPQVSVQGDIKQLIFSWNNVANADYYRLMENADGHSGFTQVGDDIPIDTLSATRDIAVHLHDWVNALYMVQACNLGGCTGSAESSATDVMLDTIGYFKASNTGTVDGFGWTVAMSTDGNTLAVGARNERSSATGINGDQADNSEIFAGAVYLFRFDGATWAQEAYVKASNTEAGDLFGGAVALSTDGNTLAVGARKEDSCATGINGDEYDDRRWNGIEVGDPNSPCEDSGAVYLFRFDEAGWQQQAYIKASNTEAGDFFGGAVALSADGNTLAVGARYEDSCATGINGDEYDDWPGGDFGATSPCEKSGAVYLFRFEEDGWQQQFYIKSDRRSQYAMFGHSIALNAEGDVLAVSARFEGATYVFRFDSGNWIQQAQVRPSIGSGRRDVFSTALSADGNTLAVGAPWESNQVSGINNAQVDSCASCRVGAVYLFRFDGTSWNEEAYIKASNARQVQGGGAYYGPEFGFSVALSADGNTLAAGALNEDSNATGISGDQANYSAEAAGAVYTFRFYGTNWRQSSYVKAPNTEKEDYFGGSVALDGTGELMAVGSYGEDSSATGINGDQADNSAEDSGAVYVY